MQTSDQILHSMSIKILLAGPCSLLYPTPLLHLFIQPTVLLLNMIRTLCVCVPFLTISCLALKSSASTIWIIITPRCLRQVFLWTNFAVVVCNTMCVFILQLAAVCSCLVSYAWVLKDMQDMHICKMCTNTRAATNTVDSQLFDPRLSKQWS